MKDEYTFGFLAIHKSQETLINALVRMLAGEFPVRLRRVLLDGAEDAALYATTDADILFADSEHWRSVGRPARGSDQALVLIGGADLGNEGLPRLGLPVELPAFKRVVGEVLQILGRAESSSGAPQQMAQAASPTPPSPTHAPDYSGKKLRLKRWPLAQFVRTYQEVKWATLLTANELTVEKLLDLSNYTGEPQALHLFLGALDRNDLLHVTAAQPVTPIQEPIAENTARKGLLGMIRRKLGL